MRINKQRLINDNKELKEKLIMLSCTIAGITEAYPKANKLFEKLKKTKGYTGFKTTNLLAASIIITAKQKKLRFRQGFLLNILGLNVSSTKVITKRYEEENK